MVKTHPILQRQYRSFKELEQEIGALETTTEKGEVFEQFVFSYFSLNMDFFQISKIFREKDVPANLRRKFSLEVSDSGVDGLIILKNGKSAAYQVKFRSNRDSPSYAELAKFWVEGKETDYNYTIANCLYLTNLSRKHGKHLEILVDEFDGLDEVFFNQLKLFSTTKKILPRTKYEPYDFQRKMISDVLNGFAKNDRGKLIAACGTGKTLTSLWIAEALKARKILFITPSLALIKQTLEHWSHQSSRDFDYLCVCSDTSVADDVYDDGDITVNDFIVPVTTDQDHIQEFLRNEVDEVQIIFSTYQSLDTLASAQSQVDSDKFDLAVFDEAHRTAGAKNSELFAIGLDDEQIRTSKRLFMTATERLVRPWIIERAEELDRIVFSMDDEEVYGPVFHRLNFGEAIKKKVISDYRILIAGISESEILRWINENRLLADMINDEVEFESSAQNIFRQLILLRAMKELAIYKVITFHNSINSSKEFSFGSNKTSTDLRFIQELVLSEVGRDEFFIDHINGTMSAGIRKEKLDLFKTSRYGVISNARCLNEGVDVPEIDCVYFVEPRNSLIGIVQACGRALRKPKDGPDKIASFIIPILFPEGITNAEVFNRESFEMVFSLLQSLRDQDQRLAEWIDQLNLNAIRGGNGIPPSPGSNPIAISLPQEFDINEFNQSLFLQIADKNGDPTKIISLARTYGKKERKSDYERIFRTLGDYSYSSYKENLVDPTLKRFNSPIDRKTTDELKINHNNVSHTRRLGLIEKIDNKNYSLTLLGEMYFEKRINFEELFIRQMFRYFIIPKDKENEGVLFPYRACFNILLEMEKLDFFEFIFGLFILTNNEPRSIMRTIFSIKHLRRNYPNLGIVNLANRKTVLDELNTTFGTNYSETDVWEKKTTVNNQHIYFRNHLSLLDRAIEINRRSQIVTLTDTGRKDIADLLSDSSEIESGLSIRELQDAYEGYDY